MATKRLKLTKLISTYCFLWVLSCILSIEFVSAEDQHLGLLEYEIACMSCHGPNGKGDGPYASKLQIPPSDLTQIAQSNDGKFPIKKITEIIDGRARVATHGEREMPIWGNRYRVSLHESETASDIERRANIRINALVNYLKTIQE